MLCLNDIILKVKLNFERLCCAKHNMNMGRVGSHLSLKDMQCSMCVYWCNSYGSLYYVLVLRL